MNSESKQSKIGKLQRQLEITKARLQKEQSLLKEDERKKDIRRKILLGSLWLDKLEGNFESVVPELDKFLTRDSDRKLFGLPLLESKPT
jgi:hypothetical protein